jgi:hypothetical protein
LLACASVPTASSEVRPNISILPTDSPMLCSLRTSVGTADRCQSMRLQSSPADLAARSLQDSQHAVLLFIQLEDCSCKTCHVGRCESPAAAAAPGFGWLC